MKRGEGRRLPPHAMGHARALARVSREAWLGYRRVQPQILRRVARLGPVSPEAIATIEAMLKRRGATVRRAPEVQIGGTREAARILSSARRMTEQRVMPRLAKIDRDVARAIEELGLQGKFFTAGTGMPEANKQILEKGLVHALTLWDPAEAGYAMAELARRILDKEPIEAPLDLKAEGYAEVKFAEGSDKILEGAGWIVITKDNVDSFGF